MNFVLWVSPDSGNWKVQWEGGNKISSHETKDAAISAARKIVRDNPAGYVRQIKVQRADGTIQTEWTYGTDPYPPKG